MSSPEVELRSAWAHLTRNVPAGTSTDHLFEALLIRLGEPLRRYHTAVHVMWVLRHVRSLGHLLGDPGRLDEVELAALYHDAVYDPRRSDNEALSAELAAATAAELGWPDDRCRSVHRLVMSTATHRPQSLDEAVLVDADLAVLGGEPRSYTAYVNGIRAEYTHVTDSAWRSGRATVLRGFLHGDRVFHTDEMHSTLGARARANMTAELATLERVSRPQ
jgi:predicted metal-dependent HD superfamily phosphohydrolase